MMAVDGSVADDAVIETVAGRAWPATTEFQVVTVVDARLDAARASTESFVAWQHPRRTVAEARARLLMEKCRNRFRSAGLRVDTLIFEKDFARRLAQQAKVWEADCVFLGRPGPSRGGGSILERTVFAAAACAPCSVEVVRCRAPAPDSRGPRTSQ